jgi:hypothetical protein
MPMSELTPAEQERLIVSAPRVRLKGNGPVGIVIATSNGTVTAWWGTLDTKPIIVDVATTDVELVDGSA